MSYTKYVVMRSDRKFLKDKDWKCTAYRPEWVENLDEARLFDQIPTRVCSILVSGQSLTKSSRYVYPAGGLVGTWVASEEMRNEPGFSFQIMSVAITRYLGAEV